MKGYELAEAVHRRMERDQEARQAKAEAKRASAEASADKPLTLNDTVADRYAHLPPQPNA